MERPFSLYADLGLPPDAPAAAVEAAYRRLMKRHHPDHAGPGSASRAAEINAAYSVLRDPAPRAAYDRREHARLHALRAAHAERYARRRRIVRSASWMAAAIALGAGIPLGANWFNGGIVPQRTGAAAVAAAPAPVAEAPPPLRDPIEHIADFLTKAHIGRPALRAPPKPPAASTETAPRMAAAVRAEAPMRLRRSAPQPRPAATRKTEPAEPDFLEREGFIY